MYIHIYIDILNTYYVFVLCICCYVLRITHYVLCAIFCSTELHSTTQYVLCTMYYTVCIMYYALCIMYYELMCSVIQTREANKQNRGPSQLWWLWSRRSPLARKNTCITPPNFYMTTFKIYTYDYYPYTP